MKLWNVTFTPENLLDGDQFSPQDANSVGGRQAIHSEIDQLLDADATHISLDPVEE